MKKLYSLLCLLLVTVLSTQSQVSIKWQKSYGGSGDDHVANDSNYYDSPDHCSVKTSDGGFIITGFSDSNDGLFPNNHGSSDYVIVKCDSSGNVQWSNSFGGSSYEQATSIIQTSDGGYAIAGWSLSDSTGTTWNNYGGGDVLIVKVDSLGNQMWAKNYGGSSDERAYSLTEASDHGIVVGAMSSSMDFDLSGNNGNSDYWIFKVDTSGTMIWQHNYGGSSTEWLNAISPTSDGGYVLCGFTLSVDSDVTANNGSYDYWIVKVDSLGIKEWEKSLGGQGNDWGTDIVQSRDGGYAVCGMSESIDGDVTGAHGGHDYWIAKLSSTGSLVWQKDVGGSLIDEPYEIIQTLDNGYLIAGTSNSNDGDIAGNYGLLDYLLVKLESSGTLSWEKTFGGSQSDWAISVTENSEGNYILDGNSKSSDHDVTVNNGGWDFWVICLTPNYNTIRGQYYVDVNNNSVFDTGDYPLSHELISDSVNRAYCFTDSLGYYNLEVANTGTFEVHPDSLNNYIVSPASQTATFNFLNETDSLNDFVATAIPGLNDLKINLLPLTRFRPGFFVEYLINYMNVGTTSLTGSIYMILDPQLTFDSASVTPDSIVGDTIYWNNITLAALQSGSIHVYSTLDAAAGGTVSSSVVINDGNIIVDENYEDNFSSWTGNVTGSLDPNDKDVSMTKIYTNQLADSPYLDYVVRFQNTGTDTAFTVVVRDTISSMLDINSFTFVNSSHPVSVELNTIFNLITFRFSNILLADSNVNENQSHGFVQFKIKPGRNLVVNDVIENKAGIYFDFNQPVITNTTTTSVELPTSIKQISKVRAVIYPNPANDILKVILDSKNSSEAKVVEVYNSTGSLVMTKEEKAGSNKFDLRLTDLPSGLYLLKVKIGNDAVTKRIVKE